MGGTPSKEIPILILHFEKYFFLILKRQRKFFGKAGVEDEGDKGKSEVGL